MPFNNHSRDLLSLVHHSERDLHYLPELSRDLLTAVFVVVQRCATAMVEGLGAEGSWVAQNNVVSQAVPHVHVHVVPRTRGDGLRGFFWPRTTYADDAEMADYTARLRGALTRSNL